MAQNNSISAPICVGPRGVTRYVCAFGRDVRAWIFRAASLLRKHDTANPQWLNAGEACWRRTRNRYEIYTEDIGAVGLKNIQTLLDRRKQCLPGSTIHMGLVGRYEGETEASLKVDIVTKDEEAVLEMAAEIRRLNGQRRVDVYITPGTSIEIAGPKGPIVEIRDDAAPDNVRDGGVSQKEHEVSDLKPPAVAVAR